MGRIVDLGLIYRLESERHQRDRDYVCPMRRDLQVIANAWYEEGIWFRVPEADGKVCGEVRHLYGNPEAPVCHLNVVGGEIPWRTLPNYDPCPECGHPPKYHGQDDDGWWDCSHGQYVNDQGQRCYPCNCGNNIGR